MSKLCECVIIGVKSEARIENQQASTKFCVNALIICADNEVLVFAVEILFTQNYSLKK